MKVRLPRRVVQRFQPEGGGGAGVVDQDIDAAETTGRRLNQRGAVLRSGDVADMGEGVAAPARRFRLRRHGFRSRRQMVGAAGGHYHIGPFGDETARGGEAEAVARAGDDGGLTAELQVKGHVVPLQVFCATKKIRRKGNHAPPSGSSG